MVDAVVRAAKAVGAERAHFVGHSMGTIVCQHVAEQHPELVRSLRSVRPDPSAAGAGAARAWADRAAKARNEGMPGIADQIVQATLPATPRATRRWRSLWCASSSCARTPKATPRTAKRWRRAQPANLDRIKCPRAPRHRG